VVELNRTGKIIVQRELAENESGRSGGFAPWKIVWVPIICGKIIEQRMLVNTEGGREVPRGKLCLGTRRCGMNVYERKVSLYVIAV